MSLLLTRVGAPPAPDTWVPVFRAPALAAAVARASQPRVVLVGSDPVAAPADVWAVSVPRAAQAPARLGALRGVMVAADLVAVAADAWVPIVSAVPLRRVSSGLVAGAYPVVDASLVVAADAVVPVVYAIAPRRGASGALRVPLVAADPVVAAADAAPVVPVTPRKAAAARAAAPAAAVPTDQPVVWAAASGPAVTRLVRVSAPAAGALVVPGADDALTWCPSSPVTAGGVVSRLAPYRPGRVAVTWPTPAGPVFDYVTDPFDAPAPAGTSTSVPTLDTAAGLLTPDVMLGPGVVLDPDGLVRSGAYSPADPAGSSSSMPVVAGYNAPSPAGSSASLPILKIDAGLLAPDSMLGPGVVLTPDGVRAGGSWSVPAPAGSVSSSPVVGVFSSSPSGAVSDAPQLLVEGGALLPDSMLGPGVVLTPDGMAVGGAFGSPSPMLVGG